MRLPSHILALCIVLAACGREADRKAIQVLPADAETVHAAIRDSGGKAVLVNFWATWCVPCVEEFPDMMRVYRAHKDDGLRLILVSGDFDNQLDRVKAFLEAQGVDFTTYVKTGSDTRFIDGVDPEWSGAAPATWVFDAGGKRRAFWEGKATYEKFEQIVSDVLNNPS